MIMRVTMYVAINVYDVAFCALHVADERWLPVARLELLRRQRYGGQSWSTRNQEVGNAGGIDPLGRGLRVSSNGK